MAESQVLEVCWEKELRAFNKAAVAMGCPSRQLITGENCHVSVRAGPFVSCCPQRLKAAEPMAGWCQNNKIRSATDLAGLAACRNLTPLLLVSMSCPCHLQPHPPKGQSWSLCARSAVGLSSTVAGSGLSPALCLYQQSQASCTSALCSFSAASAPLQGNPKVYTSGKVSLHSSPLLSATEMCVTEMISKGFNQSGCQSTSCERVLCNGKAF